MRKILVNYKKFRSKRNKKIRTIQSKQKKVLSVCVNGKQYPVFYFEIFVLLKVF